jgi:hypothetical protein
MAGKPLSQAGPDFARRLSKLASAVENGSRDTVQEMGMAAKTAHLAILKADSGGDLRLSGVGRRKGRAGNRKIGARYDLDRTGAGKHRATIRATGPVHFVANPMSGHVIRSAYAKGRRVRGFVGPTAAGQFGGGRRAVLRIPGIGYRRSVRHPGTTGKDSWRRGERRARPKVSKVARKRTANVISRGFA